METNFNFNSQVCTDRVQSERLLALGLKKETADMMWGTITLNGEPFTFSSAECWDNATITETHFPAWSLHRLMCMIPNVIKADKRFKNSFSCLMNIMLSTIGIAYYYEDYDDNRIYQFESFGNLMEASVDCIEWLIKEGYFNKENLEE